MRLKSLCYLLLRERNVLHPYRFYHFDTPPFRWLYFVDLGYC